MVSRLPGRARKARLWPATGRESRGDLGREMGALRKKREEICSGVSHAYHFLTMKMLRTALFSVFLIAVAALARAEAVAPQPAPVWKLKDVEGKVISSETFKGKVVVVDFWATWCPPCRAEIPGYIELQKKYGKDGLVIIGVSLDQKGPAVVKPFIEKFGINYQIVMGDDDITAAFGGMDAIPTTFIIDRAGIIRDRKVGAEPTEDYEKRIVAVLKKG